MARYQVVRSKIKKTKVLLTDDSISKYIPETVLFSEENIRRMLSNYSFVYIKPNRGSKGSRVAAIRKKLCYYDIYYKTQVIPTFVISGVIAFVNALTCGDPFLIQQGIEVLKVKQKPFDFRVMVQKPYSEWKVSNIIGRVAAPGMIVTNLYLGAEVANYDELMQRANIADNEARELRQKLYSIAERTALVLNNRYAGLRELGIDIGIDQNLNPWIFEVNTKPIIIKNNNDKVNEYHKIIMNNLKNHSI
ncbi:MAG: YheC/YheD family protein [Dethiobacter sp.]|jgi:glutathione synthase/RimK-type ligase-like ATP-grasp enzyme|nr:YheC/YheD family protein [Dethiobacter sp.]